MASLTEQAWVLPREKHAPRHARRQIVESCADAPPERLDDAGLLVSELVANAVLHGDGPVGLVVSRAGTKLRVAVEDESPELPVLRQSPGPEAHGRGMHLVANLANRWGVAPRADGKPGKSVWFEIT